MEAVTQLQEDQCFVDYAEGTFQLTRVWAKKTATAGLQELFEGFFTFDCELSSMYERKGFDTSFKYKLAF